MAEDIPRNPSPEQLDAIGQWGTNVADAAANKLHQDLKFVNTIFGGAPKEAANAIGQGLDAAGKGLEEAGQGFTQGLNDFGAGIVQGATDFGNGVGEFFGGIADRANKTFSVLTTGQLPGTDTQEVTEISDKNTLMDAVMGKVNEMAEQLKGNNPEETATQTIEDEAIPMAKSPTAETEDAIANQSFVTSDAEKSTKKQNSNGPKASEPTTDSSSSGSKQNSSPSTSSGGSSSKPSNSGGDRGVGQQDMYDKGWRDTAAQAAPAPVGFSFKNISKNVDVNKVAQEMANLEIAENPSSRQVGSTERIKVDSVDFSKQGMDTGLSYT